MNELILSPGERKERLGKEEKGGSHLLGMDERTKRKKEREAGPHMKLLTPGPLGGSVPLINPSP